jgi:hypothetical protein
MVTALSINTGGLGRFGNQLFTIAGTIGTAIKNGHDYGFPKWINKDNGLFGDTVEEMEQYFVNPLPTIPDSIRWEEIGYRWNYEPIELGKGNYNLHRHFQSPKYFDTAMDEVRHYFRMKDEPEQNDYVAIHYRAGDYDLDDNGWHPRCSKEYYQEAVKQFHKGTTFLLFSDDYKEASYVFDNIHDEISIYASLAESYLDDFKLMKRCKSFIIANSSFSAMAALLGEHPDKKVIAPSKWFGKAADPVQWETKDIYHEDWVVI